MTTTYPNAYPIDADRAEVSPRIRRQLTEKTGRVLPTFAYEPEGRMFESCRAHHYFINQFNDLRGACVPGRDSESESVLESVLIPRLLR